MSETLASDGELLSVAADPAGKWRQLPIAFRRDLGHVADLPDAELIHNLCLDDHDRSAMLLPFAADAAELSNLQGLTGATRAKSCFGTEAPCIVGSIFAISGCKAVLPSIACTAYTFLGLANFCFWSLPEGSVLHNQAPASIGRQQIRARAPCS